MRSYETTAPAGASTTLTIKGTFLALTESSADDKKLRVEAIAQDGTVVIDANMRAGEKFPTGRPFEQVRISNPEGYDIKVTIVAGDGAFQSDRLTGEVTISGAVGISPEKSIFGRLFNWGNYSYGSSSQCRAAIIYNPVGSGVRAVLRKTYCINRESGGNAISIQKLIGVKATLANAVNSQVAGPMVGEKGSSACKVKMLATSAAFTSTYSGQWDAYAPLVSGGSDAGEIQAHEKLEIPELVVLEEGEALCMYSKQFNKDFNFMFCWEELPA